MMTPETLSLVDRVADDLLRELRRFHDGIQDRGRRYRDAGRVGRLEFAPGRVRATVLGQQPYATEWILDRRGWHPACSCPVSPRCKHAYALGATLFEALLEPSSLEAELEQLIRGLPTDREPAEERSRERLRPVASFVPPPRGDERTRALPPRPARTAPATLTTLRRARGRSDRLLVLEQLLIESGIASVDVNHPAFVPLMDERVPEFQAWLLAHEILRWTDGALPPAFEPYRDRPDLEQRLAETQIPLIDEALRSWARRFPSRGERSLRLVFRLDRTMRGQVAFSLEARVSSTRLRDEVRNENQLRALRSDAARNPQLLTRQHQRLLEALIAFYDRASHRWDPYDRLRSPRGSLADFLVAILPSPDVAWSDTIDAPLAERAGIVPGEVVRFASTPVQLAVGVERAGADACLRLDAVWPDGRRREASQIVHLTQPDVSGEPTLGMVLADGVLSPVEEAPPGDVLALLRASSPLRVTRRQGEGLIRTLAEAIPSARIAAESLTSLHRVEPVVQLRLDDDDWLQIRLFACSVGAGWVPGQPIAKPSRLFEYTPAPRWEELAPAVRGGAAAAALRIEAAPAAADPAVNPAADPVAATDAEPSSPVSEPIDPEAWFHAPERSCVAPIVAWLEALGAGSGAVAEQRGRGPQAIDIEIGWWIRLGPRTAPVLAEAWQHRPHGVRWYGNESMQGLLGKNRTLRPRISAKRHGVDLLAVSAEWEAEGMWLTEEDLERLRAATAVGQARRGWVRREVPDVRDEVRECSPTSASSSAAASSA